MHYTTPTVQQQEEVASYPVRHDQQHSRTHTHQQHPHAPQYVTRTMSPQLLAHPEYHVRSATLHKPAVAQCKTQWMHTIHNMHKAGELDEHQVSDLSAHILCGISLTFNTIPSPIVFTNTHSVSLHIDEVRQTLAEYIAFGAVEPVPSTPPPVMVQPLHVIIKPNKAPRLVIDLSRNLNHHLPYTYFTYSSVTTAVSNASHGCWFAKLDITKCYLSFPLDPSVHHYFTFSLDSRYYQFTRMPFGLSTAPRICTELLGVIAWHMKRNGIDPVRYLDDFLFIANTQQACQAMLDESINILAMYGLMVNPTKTAGPSQVITFLGIELDSMNMTMRCTEERLEELTSLLRLTSSRSTTRVHQLESLIGKLSFAAQVLPGARPFMRRLLDQCRSASHRSQRVRLSKPFFLDISYWLAHLLTWNGRQLWRYSQPVVLVSDASLSGFGFYLEHLPSHIDNQQLPLSLRLGHTYVGSYGMVHAAYHQDHRTISWCEMFSALAALLIYSPILTNQSVLIVIDNQTDVNIFNRQATRSPRLAILLRAIADLSTRLNVSLKAVHRPGEENLLADLLSRPSIHQGDPISHWHHHDMFAVSHAYALSSQHILMPELEHDETVLMQPSICLVNWRCGSRPVLPMLPTIEHSFDSASKPTLTL
jgi:hypothetical protein